MNVTLVLLTVSSLCAEAPRTWTQSAIDTLELPLANSRYSPVHIGEEAYYRIPTRILYKTYPVYAPGREPAGYRDWLNTREPEVEFDASKLKIREQWIGAGELVFNAPTSFNPVFFSAENVRDPGFYKQTGMPVGANGVVPSRAGWSGRRGP